MNNSLKIALASLALIILGMLPAFTGFIPQYKLHLVTVVLRIGLIYIALSVPIVLAVRQFLLNCYDTPALKKYIILFLGFVSFSYLAIFTDLLAFSYKAITLEQKKASAFIDTLCGSPNTALISYEEVISEQKKLENSFKEKEALFMLAAPLTRFCFIDLFSEDKSSRWRLLEDEDGK
ncbi:MAG: hypothetical protein K2X90_02865 [Candidatus Babeliaceae bacterium]|nr:hypothetical protein [Candidatus Babeliaceae bacterium]